MNTGFEATQEFFDLWQKMYKDTYGKLVELPAFGPLREKQEKVSKDFSASINFYTSLMEFNMNFFTVIMEANQRTFEKIAQEAIDSKKELKDLGYKEFYNIWIETYSDTFKEFIKSGHFSADIGRVTSNLIDYQKYNKELLEENLLKPLKLPTRTEIDEMNKELYDSKKAVKELKEIQQDLAKDVQQELKEMKEIQQDLVKEVQKELKEMKEIQQAKDVQQELKEKKEGGI